MHGGSLIKLARLNGCLSWRLAHSCSFDCEANYAEKLRGDVCQHTSLDRLCNEPILDGVPGFLYLPSRSQSQAKNLYWFSVGSTWYWKQGRQKIASSGCECDGGKNEIQFHFCTIANNFRFEFSCCFRAIHQTFLSPFLFRSRWMQAVNGLETSMNTTRSHSNRLLNYNPRNGCKNVEMSKCINFNFERFG